MSSVKTHMRAVTVDRDARLSMALHDVDRPRPCSNEALVRVAAISLNPREIRQAISRGIEGSQLGWDFAGMVEIAASDGSGPAVGDRVAGLVRCGAWAELVAVPTYAVAAIPSAVSFAQAAALPVAGLTALHGLGYGGLLAAKHLLVTGATGGVGTLAVQLAHLSGACVTAAVRNPEHAALLEEYGADYVLTGDPSDLGPFGPYHLVLDAVGGPSLTSGLNRLLPGGTYVLYGGDALVAGITGKTLLTLGNTRLRGFALRDELRSEPASEGLRRLLALVDANSLHPHVEDQAPWAEIADVAHHLLERVYVGKAVLHL